ncbi:MAG: PAS domain-containing sensor histidine kinase, partial [Desulfuromusa sp.]|nr:PAS domain-containing sensor histidine kinase [Desulfuromusa sp.]
DANDISKYSTHWVYNQVMDHLDVGIIVLDDKEKEIIYQNNAAEIILQKSLNDPDYQNISQMLLTESNQTGTSENALEFRSGNRLMGYSIYNISTDCNCILIRDITEKSRLMSIAEAVNVMDNTSYIFSSIRHEIGNPINSIKITMSVLKHKLDKFSPETIEEYVERCLVEISRVEYLLKSLKNFSLFENIQLKDTDLKAFLEKFLFMVKSDFEAMGVPVKIKLTEQQTVTKIDPRAFQHVLLNLLTNAKAALENNDNPELLLDLDRKDGLIWLRIQDNGCGIPAEDLQNIFKPFYTTKEDGTGLGLVIARKMLAQMNCSIEFQSQEGTGTIITILMPEATDVLPAGT